MAQQQQPLPIQRDPIQDAIKVVDSLRNNRTIDTTFKKVLEALRHHEGFRGKVKELMQHDGMLPHGDKPAERGKTPESFVRSQERQLLNLARDTLYSILTDDRDPQGLAAEHKLVIQQALISVLETEELPRQKQFREMHERFYQHPERYAQEEQQGIVGQQQQQQ